LVSYAQLKSGRMTIEGKTVRVAPLASLARSRQVAEELKRWIQAGQFFLAESIIPLPRDRRFIPQDLLGNQRLSES
ncbi:MAG: homocysteine biosynthesis protein, partial [Microcystaceae cyanobacterium]